MRTTSARCTLKVITWSMWPKSRIAILFLILVSNSTSTPRLPLAQRDLTGSPSSEVGYSQEGGSMNNPSLYAHKPIRTAITALALVLILTFLMARLPDAAEAAAGDLDPTFGGDDTVTTDIKERLLPVTLLGGSGTIVTAVVLGHGYGNGNLVTISGASPAEYNGTFPITVATVDSFTYQLSSPVTSTPATGSIFAQRTGALDRAGSIALQPDGKILVGGGTNFRAEAPEDLSLVRYNPDGSLDPSFGNGGIASVRNGGNAISVLVQADGKIVVGAT